MGRPNGERRCLDEEGLGPRRHCAGRRPPLSKRRWLRERKPVAVDESRATLEAAFPIALGIVPWKAQNRMVGQPLIELDR